MATYNYENGTFIIHGYDSTPPFCSFLPGLTGANGTPMWSFYCNRGQGICSFGIENKANSIMEFFPANSAYQHVSMQGYRTFIEESGGVLEPFAVGGAGEREFKISPNSLSISETTMDWKFEVTYFIMPEEDFPAMVRRAKLTNISGARKSVKILDGVPQIIPYGVTTGAYKEMSNLQKSWINIAGMEHNLPFYHLLTVPGDEAEIDTLQGAYFYLSFRNDGEIIRPIIDTSLIFGEDVSFKIAAKFPVPPQKQNFTNKYSCAFTPIYDDIESGETISWNSLIGFAADIDTFAERSYSLCNVKYLDEKEKRAALTESELSKVIETHTGNPLFDGFIRQSYIDNMLRGGVPFVLADKIIHLFSRKHGDPERDYNFFSIAAEFFSQGNGNFRDVCQNRRNDVFFYPEAGEYNIKTFFSLMQADGFNPLEVRGTTFSIKKECMAEFKRLMSTVKNPEPIEKLCQSSFTAGQIMNTIHQRNVIVTGSDIDFLVSLLSLSEQNIEAVFGEGYWIDHWTYLMDLIDSYLSIYPDKKDSLLFESKDYKFFESPVRIRPRRESYVLKNGKLRQLGSIERIKNRPDSAWLKTHSGETYKTTLFGKMICLAVVKYLSLDPIGCGLSMDGGKPGWNDAMNGLPALFGSGMGESLELGRMVAFLRNISGYKRAFIPIEVGKLMRDTRKIYKNSSDPFEQWNLKAELLESFRESLLQGISGEEEAVPEVMLNEVFDLMKNRLDNGAKRALALGDGIMPTYITFTPTKTNESGFVLGMEPTVMPTFLEGPVRYLKTIDDEAQSREIYQKIKESDLYDKKLHMYKTSVSLDECGYEIGRIRSFSPGWLERESIFMHMEYKYLLELLRAGLYDEFFSDIQTALPPFMDPAVYGRSTLEGSSFIASSNNPDPTIVGRGFVSRLSGSTSEIISMWQHIFWGDKPFFMENDTLCFQLKPVLPEWLFDDNNEICFTLLGKIPVTYQNPKRKNTYGNNAVCIKQLRVVHNNEEIIVEGGKIEGLLAHDIRDSKASLIIAVLG